VTAKKAKGDGSATATESVKASEPKKRVKPVDMERVREDINNLVGESATVIAIKLIDVAKTGQLAAAKYLFEVVGLYPATEQTAARAVDKSLAHTLLTRLGLPLEPVITDEEMVPAVLGGDVIGTAKPWVGAMELVVEQAEGKSSQRANCDGEEDTVE
jgi:hypothetical protein